MSADYVVLGDCPFKLDGKPALKVQCKRCKTYGVVTRESVKKPCDICQAELKKMVRNR